MNDRSTSASIRLDAVSKSYDGRVMAVDDVENAQYCEPPLTTIRQPFNVLAAKACSLLCDHLEGGPPVGGITRVPVELVLRKDVADENCPHCWTPCEAYPTVLANLAQAAVKRTSRKELPPAPATTASSAR